MGCPNAVGGQPFFCSAGRGVPYLQVPGGKPEVLDGPGRAHLLLEVKALRVADRGRIMIGFCIKKWFFDFWDNMIKIVLINFGYVLLLGLAVYLPYLFSFSTFLMLVSAAVALTLFNIYTGAASRFMREVADYETPGFKDFFLYVKEMLKASLLLSVIVGMELFLILVGIPYYIAVGGVIGLVIVSLIFWASVIWWLAWQYYFPARTRLDTNLRKVVKKMFILLLDNTGFTLFMAFFSLVIIVLSAITALLLPGLASVLLLHQVGLRLRLYKYDYLEEHPEANNSSIPWDALLLEDRERVGHRTVKGMIFPWKE